MVGEVTKQNQAAAGDLSCFDQKVEEEENY